MPNTFTSSSLTSLGTIKTSNIGGNENVSGNLNISGLLTTTGNGLFVNNLTISGILQSFQTSLLSTSSSVIDAKLGTIIGVSIPQFLTRNETVLPNTFNTCSIQNFQGFDNYALKGGSSVNSYLQFENNTYGSNTCYNGLINGTYRIYSPGEIDFYSNGGTLCGLFNSGNLNLSNNLTVSGTFQSFQTSLLNTSSSIIDREG